MRTYGRLFLVLVPIVLAVAGHTVRSDDQTDAARNTTAFSEAERSYWAFQSVANPQPPLVKAISWPKSPLDHFILAQLESNGLEPAPAADKRTLIRRASFDLIGLPPTPEEIDAFLADESPGAFARVVDRLLASPHYGERWGRHWLDVARYADSNGMDENLIYGNAFRYRDYVIAAFNKDKPYDQFIREQLAGDLLAARSNRIHAVSASNDDPMNRVTTNSEETTEFERVVATGFLSIGPKMLAEDDPVKMEMDIIDEQIDTIGRTIMGLTLGCARCHDHKYDPLRTEDYYSLAGIFKSTQTMDNFKVVARWHERPLGSKEAIARQQAHEHQIGAKKTEISRLTEHANDTLLSAARRRVADYLLTAAEVQRRTALQKELKSVLADPVPPAGSVPVIIEAEQFTRGNVKKEFTGYGEKIGVIYNQGELPNFAEYDINVVAAASSPAPGGDGAATEFVLPAAPAYQLELRYAAAESRPVKLLINGQLVKASAAGKTTGTWYPDSQSWTAEGVFRLSPGKNTIRLERAEPFPHFDKLALVPLKSDSGAIESAPKTPEQLATEQGLNPDILQQWVRYLDATRSDPNSVLYGWHALAALSPAPATRQLFDDLKASALRALAARFQELLDQADQAWQQLKAAQADAKELPDPNQESLRKLLYDPQGPFAVPPKPESYYPAETTAALKRLRDELASLEKSFTRLPEAMAMNEGKPQNLRVHIRGNHLTLGDEVPRQFPRILAGTQQTPIDDTHSGRLQLAEWLTQPTHPLTARVMVNRIWRWHFGAGLVRTPDNFGRLGERPTNPALLDWLARRFVGSGWSIKALHRLIMLSSTYQMSTSYNEKAAASDPENRLHWRMNRRRLEAEAIRDAILATSGQLDCTVGGSVLEGGNRSYVPGYPNTVYDKYDFNRRSVYLPVLRSLVYDVFQAFDFADPSVCNGDRPTTTVAPQALFTLNSKLMQDQTRQMADSLLVRPDLDDRGRVRVAFERAFGRFPHENEFVRALEFVQGYEAALAKGTLDAPERRTRSWQALCRTILASHEFIYVE